MNTWNEIIKSINLPKLKAGKHTSPEYGLCAMEMVAYMEGLPHSDHPKCTCPSIAAYVRLLNDVMTDSQREKYLKPILWMLPGTNQRGQIYFRQEGRRVTRREFLLSYTKSLNHLRDKQMAEVMHSELSSWIMPSDRTSTRKLPELSEYDVLQHIDALKEAINMGNTGNWSEPTMLEKRAKELEVIND